jgi:hypothetical protein
MTWSPQRNQWWIIWIAAASSLFLWVDGEERVAVAVAVIGALSVWHIESRRSTPTPSALRSETHLHVIARETADIRHELEDLKSHLAEIGTALSDRQESGMREVSNHLTELKHVLEDVRGALTDIHTTMRLRAGEPL